MKGFGPGMALEYVVLCIMGWLLGPASSQLGDRFFNAHHDTPPQVHNNDYLGDGYYPGNQQHYDPRYRRDTYRQNPQYGQGDGFFSPGYRGNGGDYRRQNGNNQRAAPDNSHTLFDPQTSGDSRSTLLKLQEYLSHASYQPRPVSGQDYVSSQEDYPNAVDLLFHGNFKRK